MVSSFKRQQLHCGEPRVKEALVQLNCGVKTVVLSHHQLLLANDCSKNEQVYPDNMVTNNFYLQLLPFDLSNGSW